MCWVKLWCRGSQLEHSSLVAPGHVGSYFPDQGSNQILNHWITREVQRKREGNCVDTELEELSYKRKTFEVEGSS